MRGEEVREVRSPALWPRPRERPSPTVWEVIAVRLPPLVVPEGKQRSEVLVGSGSLNVRDQGNRGTHQSLLMRLCWGLMCRGGENLSLRPRS